MDNEEKMIEKRSRLIPLSKWNDYHIWPSLSGLRSYVFFEKENGFDRVVLRVGKRVLIDEDAFFEWVESQNKREE